jgi:hypothetical protein
MDREDLHALPILNESFPHNYRARALPSPVLAFGENRRETFNMAIEVISSRESWTAVFSDGMPIHGKIGLFSCPNPDELCVLSGSNAYIFNTTRASNHDPASLRFIVDAIPVVESSVLVLASFDITIGLGTSGIKWRSERICDDELSVTKEADGSLRATGFSQGQYIHVHIDSRTGKIAV